MLLSYKKAATASSSDPGHATQLAFDEDIKTYWAARTGNKDEFLQVDLGSVMTINAIQVNYADHHSNLFGKQLNIAQQYRLLSSTDGKQWDVLIDKSMNKSDVPHDYVEFTAPVRSRYIKLVNLHVPGGNFAIGDLRVFGKADGPAPGAVSGFQVKRATDRRNAVISWKPVKGAYAYNIYYGIAPDKMYNCMMVVDQDYLNFRGLNRDVSYYFSIEALGETGVSTRSKSLGPE